MIITDPEHCRLWLKWRDYHGIIAQPTPYKSHNAKRGWFVLACDVIMLQAYWWPDCKETQTVAVRIVTDCMKHGYITNQY